MNNRGGDKQAAQIAYTKLWKLKQMIHKLTFKEKNFETQSKNAKSMD